MNSIDDGVSRIGIEPLWATTFIRSGRIRRGGACRVGRRIDVQAALNAAIVGQFTSGHARTWRQPLMNDLNNQNRRRSNRVIPASRQEAASSASLRSDGLL